jgi:DNA-binding NtrC family response regulator/tetratricopeptide (TPR) repeat protein
LAFRKNLESEAAETSAGDWRIGAYVDLVSERKYLLFRLKPERFSQVRPDVITFRAETAATLARDGCAQIADAEWKNDRLDILTPYLEMVDTAAMGDADGASLLRSVLQTLSVFERNRFDAPGLGIEAVGRDGSGKFVLMPNAYLVPATRSETATLARRRSPHLTPLLNIMTALAAGDNEMSSFRTRVRRVAEAVAAEEPLSLSDVHDRIFDEPLDAGTAAATIPDPTSDATVDVAAIASRLREGAVIELAGGAGAGKSRTLCALYAELEEEGSPGARWIDEWDISAMAKKRAAARDQDATVWLIDDFDDKRLVHADLTERLLDGGAGTPGIRPKLAFTLNRSRLPDNVAAELEAAKHRVGDRYRTIDIDGPGDDSGSRRTMGRIGELLRSLEAAHGQRGFETEQRAMRAVLEALHPQECHILELVSVARFPLPHDIVLSVFSEANGELHRRIHRLAGLGLLRIDYRPLPPTGQTSITLSMQSATLRRLVYEGIAPERRENLHRTVARMGEDRGGVPTTFVFEHLVAGKERQQAAKYGVALLKETPRDRRGPFLDRLIAEFVGAGLKEELSFANRLYVMHELSAELLSEGRSAEAEALLLETKEAVDDADSEERRKNASLVCDTFGLLADAWATRGNYSRALSLLLNIKESLNPHLTLSAQARLLNEIGWLQYRLGDYDRAVESCKLSLNSLNANEYPLIVAQALNVMGVINFNTSRYDEAISYYDQSAFLREREGDVNALSASYNNLGLAYQTKGEYDKALEYYNKSLEIKKMQNNRAGIAAGCLNLALLYLEVRNFEAAERNCNESLEICAELGNTRLTAENYCTLGDVEYTRGHFDEAEKYYQKSLGLSHSLETINEEMGAQRRLAQLYLTTERFAEARAAVEKAATLGRQIGSRYEDAQIETILGDLESREDRDAEAIQHYESAAASYTAAAKYRLAAPVLARIGLIHFQRGNVFEAKQYLDRSLELTRSEIGAGIPDEIVNLQQLLRERPIKGVTAGTGQQKLLYAFYELSSLSDYADDRVSFYKRLLTVFQDLTGSAQCFLAILSGEGQFAAINQNGDQEPLVDPGLRSLCTRTLQRGKPLDSSSKDAADLYGQIQVPPGNAFVCVPMRTMGRNLGCMVCYVPEGNVPFAKEDSDFLTTLGRHIAGDVRLMLHLEEHAHKEETLEKQYESLQAQVVDQYRFENLIGKDESMKKVFRTLEKVKDMDTGLLILGESGTGKTELARTIHYTSPRSKRPFQQLHCAEIPVTLLESELFGHEKGAFTGAVQRKLGRCEVADGGTVFLDDVNVIPSEIQTRLLHYLESKSFMRLGGTQKINTDVRIIAASNQDLEQLVKEGRFREDLYYRLKVILIELPPLRERREDMIAIAQAFLKKRCQAQNKALKTLSSETIKLFQKHSWPGNVRELQNILEQVVLLSDDDIVEPSSLPEDFLKRVAGSAPQHRQSLEALAEQMIESGGYSEGNPLMPQLEALFAEKMTDHVSSKSKAAALLGITKPTLYTRLRTYVKMRQS